MKKIAVLGIVALLSSAVNAQGYVGASIGRGKLSSGCESGASCNDRVSVFKLYAGTRIHQGEKFNVGVEAAYLRTVNQLENKSTTIRGGVVGVEDEFDPGVYLDTPGQGAVPFKQTLGLDAVVIAPTLTLNLTDRASVFVKTGLGLVNATLKNSTSNVARVSPTDFKYDLGGSERSDTEFQVQPYISLGFDFSVMSNLQLVGAFDYLGYKTKGENAARQVVKDKGYLKAFSLGAQYRF